MILIELFISFFTIGLFTFGGGYAMIPMITQMVTQKGWLTINELINFIAISESTPGPFAINIATFVGVSQYGIIGGIFATVGVVLPSFIIIIIVAKFFLSFKNNLYVKYALDGLRPTVIGLILSATVSIAVTNTFGEIFNIQNIDYISILIFIIIFTLNFVKKFHPIIIIIASGILGIVFYGFI